MSEYITIKENITNEIIIKKSKFITNLIRVTSEEDAQIKLQEIKKLHYKATHNCSAYILDTGIERISDDGEPSGTAGIPILTVLKKQEITNVLAVVTRYFGGIKLGKGGLIRAYSHAISDSLAEDSLVEGIILQGIELTIPYNLNDTVTYELEQMNILISDTYYQENVKIHIYIPETIVSKVLDQLNKKLNGKLNFNLLNTELKEIPLNKKQAN